MPRFRQAVHLLLALLFVGFIIPILWSIRTVYSNFMTNWNENCSRDSHQLILSNFPPRKRFNVAVASSFGFHFDVYLALAWTLERAMGEGHVHVYAEQPFFFDFQTIVDDLGLYHGTVSKYEDLIHDVINGNENGEIDMVILGTCEIDANVWSNSLLAAWDARDDDHKFQLVCMVHDRFDKDWQRTIPDWSRRNAIRLVTLSEHVKSSFQETFYELADSKQPSASSAAYEHIPIDVHIPILNISLAKTPPRRRLSKVVIQGTFSSDRRDYKTIFSELDGAIRENPREWGLKLQENSTFIPDLSLSPPFELHLYGSGDFLNVPPALANVITFHRDLNFSEFYDLMGQMDLCLPAFSSNGPSYYTEQASSTVAMALECNVPLLVTNRILKSYTHLDDERVVVRRPAAMSEVTALRVLRTGNSTEFLQSDPSETGITLWDHPGLRSAVETLVRDGWIRDRAGFEEYKEEIWRQNEFVVERLLRDLE